MTWNSYGNGITTCLKCIVSIWISRISSKGTRSEQNTWFRNENLLYIKWTIKRSMKTGKSLENFSLLIKRVVKSIGMTEKNEEGDLLTHYQLLYLLLDWKMCYHLYPIRLLSMQVKEQLEQNRILDVASSLDTKCDLWTIF